MKTVGIVCEYNPFHNGHAAQFSALRTQFGADAAIVCVMSGNFVQRGEPALLDKSVRAEAAVRCGANLLLELPVTGAVSSAEGFAAAGVAALDALGCVEALCFGCESGDPDRIMATARRLETPAFDTQLRQCLKQGISYASARQCALQALGDPDAPVRAPNDILAVEYCKALLRQRSAMTPFAVTRGGSYHAQTPDPAAPSAEALRAMEEGPGAWAPYVPQAAAAVYADAVCHRMQFGQRAVLARLRAMTDEEFSALPYGAEGLWRRFMHACRRCGSVGEIVEATKSKRYARSRINRMLLCAYLGLTELQLRTPAPYLRVLAADGTGGQLLRRIRAAQADGALPLIQAGQTPPDPAYFRLEQRCADLYTLFAPEGSPVPCRTEENRRLFYNSLRKTVKK